MKNYFNTIVVTAVVCQISQLIAYRNESFSRFVRIICSLVMLLVILSPLRSMGEITEYQSEKINRIVFSEPTPEQETENTMELAAQTIMSHAVSVTGLREQGMRITLITDNSERITDIRLYVTNCAYADRVNAEKKLNEIYGVNVKIYSIRE